MSAFALINTNRWNRIRYTFYAPGYDLAARIFSKSRNQSIRGLEINPKDEVLIVGAGTGLDLEFIHEDCHITATDITRAMIERTLKKNIQYKRNLTAEVMDGQQLNFADQSVDKIILHLILAVIVDPISCIKECERVLKPGGSITIFDKFVPRGREISFLRRMLNPIANLFFTNINRLVEDIVAHTNLKIESDESVDFNGNFRIIRLRKY
jgi:phosphatidylethanolamine/phosphatidyl-N-methylethanolamine N-methyltransferase